MSDPFVDFPRPFSCLNDGKIHPGLQYNDSGFGMEILLSVSGDFIVGNRPLACLNDLVQFLDCVPARPRCRICFLVASSYPFIRLTVGGHL
jgi:hypothetical protein